MVNTWQVDEDKSSLLLVQYVFTEVFDRQNRELSIAVITCTSSAEYTSWHQAIHSVDFVGLTEVLAL